MADLGQQLLAIARLAIAEKLGLSAPTVRLDSPRLSEAAATFVTLTHHGQLRGCIGTLEAHRPLAEDVAHNARAAAFADPRFAPVSAAEWPGLAVEVSVLSAPQAMRFSDEADALAQLRPGVDGVVLTYGLHRATFLPQVWEVLPEPRQFLAELKQKAGLPANFWASDLRLARYQVEKFKEA
jgi:AmmeMemoRadiSam system protein A